MDGWIGLSGCGCGKWKVESEWKVDVESGKWRGSGSHISTNSSASGGLHTPDGASPGPYWGTFSVKMLKCSSSVPHPDHLDPETLTSQIAVHVVHDRKLSHSQ